MRFLLIFIWLIFLLSCAPATKEDQVKDWLYYYDLGMSALSAKNYSEAIANFFIATQKAPNEPKVWNSLWVRKHILLGLGLVLRRIGPPSGTQTKGNTQSFCIKT
jgi:hypothetical protein